MSGSVANPIEVADWLRGHDEQLVSEGKRPVPLNEVFAESLQSAFSWKKDS